MRNHLDDHCAGTLSGSVPQEYLDARDLELCSVCGLLVKRFHNGVHPRCCPEARARASGSAPSGAPAAPAEPGLPTFADIMQAPHSTMQHVPRAARAAWAQCLARAAASAAARNSTAAWQELLMLPKALLVAPRRGGVRHRAQAAQATRRRCLRWLDGERASLWEELEGQPLRRQGSGTTTSAARHSRCRRLAAEGDLSKACSVLTEPAALPPSQSTLEELQAKHPQASPPDLAALGSPRPGAVPEFDQDALSRAVRSFKRGSAPGPSGLRPDHVREALLTAHSDEVLTHLVALCP